VKTAAFKIPLLVLVLSLSAAFSALAQGRDINFHWAPSRVTSGDGLVRPKAVSYEIWLRKGSESAQLVATVPDTTYSLYADAGVAQVIRVRGVDKFGNKSVWSEWSDPIFFEVDGELVTTPRGPQLKSNYPNPFNPETRIVYGIPHDIKSTDRVQLEIFSVQGYRVRSLEVDRSPGWHEVAWNGKDERGVVMSAGMYVTRFIVGDDVKTGKMTMVK